MTQLSPSSLYQSQAAAMIKDFEISMRGKNFKSFNEVLRDLKGILSAYNDLAGGPLYQPEPFMRGEPPLSAKWNRQIRQIEQDFNNAENDVPQIASGAVATHNYMTMEILKAERENARALNKLRTLMLYTSAHDQNIRIGGDFFNNEDFVDRGLTPPFKQAALPYPGVVTLRRERIGVNPLAKAKVTILETSNGFAGNNHEVESEDKWLRDPLTNESRPVFKAEFNRRSDLKLILDGFPTTWFEYESVYVLLADRESALNYNFTFVKSLQNVITGPYNNELSAYSDSALTGVGANPNYALEQSEQNLVDWALPPGVDLAGLEDFNNLGIDSGSALQILEDLVFGRSSDFKLDPLRLDLEIDLQEVKSINSISYRPFPLAESINYPQKITKVQISQDQKDWVTVSSKEVWVGSEVDMNTLAAADDFFVGTAYWFFRSREARYIRIYIEQDKTVDTRIGHVYWESKPSVTNIDPITGRPFVYYSSSEYLPDTSIVDLTTIVGQVDGSDDQNDALGSESNVVSTANNIIPGERVAGPSPPIHNPTQFYGFRNVSYRDNLKKIEVFDAKRWVIAVRDISVEEVKYSEVSEIVSEPYTVNGVVDRVALEAEYQVPDTFSASERWVKFYISPDDGATWYEISPIQDDYNGIPEVIVFNDPLPSEFREKGAVYYDVDGTVKSIRIKIELSRPDDLVSSTPELNWYKPKIVERV